MALPILSLLILILHLFLEGWRWQMLPAYSLFVIIGIPSLLLLLQPAGFSPKRWGIALTLGILGAVFWLFALILPIILPVPRLLRPTGTYQVGTTIRYLVDDSRQEIYTQDPNDSRELLVQIWYPIEAAGDAERALYMPELDVIGPVVAEQFGLPSFLLNHINLTRLDIYKDAPVAETAAATPFPVIVFSHGLTGLRIQNTIMAQELASHGYVVAAIDHTYANAITVFPDGRVILYEESRVFPSGDSNYIEANPLIQVWAADIAFLLDEMGRWTTTEGEMFHGRLDPQNAGVFGHSTGGGTAVEFCLRDGRCQAGIGLDSWVLPVTEALLTPGLDQPFMFISTPGWLGSENKARGLAIYNRLSNGGYNLSLENTGHYDFSDLALLSPITPQLGLSGTINSYDSLAIQNEYIVAFFDQYLRGMEREVLERPSPYPELTIEKR